MRPTLLLLALVLALQSTLLAGETNLPNGITVSDQYSADLTPLVFDAEPGDMTRAQFAEWANKRNEKQLSDAQVRHEKYLKERGPLQIKAITGGSGSSRTQYGGGYGAGGFGGYGGYLGYGNHTGMNYGGQAGQQGNTISSTRSESSYSYTNTYPDLNDAGGGPVTFINPYCRDYWKKSHVTVVKPEMTAAEFWTKHGPCSCNVPRDKDGKCACNWEENGVTEFGRQRCRCDDLPFDHSSTACRCDSDTCGNGACKARGKTCCEKCTCCESDTEYEHHNLPPAGPAPSDD